MKISVGKNFNNPTEQHEEVFPFKNAKTITTSYSNITHRMIIQKLQNGCTYRNYIISVLKPKKKGRGWTQR